MFEACGELDTVYVPVGMGSGISGLIRVRDLLGLRTDIVGVVALAGLLAERELVQSRRVAVIQTGGNIDADMFAAVLAGQTPKAHP